LKVKGKDVQGYNKDITAAAYNNILKSINMYTSQGDYYYNANATIGTNSAIIKIVGNDGPSIKILKKWNIPSFLCTWTTNIKQCYKNHEILFKW
jgi:hypothetical protein